MMILKSGCHPASFAMCRGWYRRFFRDHYGSASGDPEAVFGIGRTRDKIKVWCIECYHHCLLGVMNLTPELLRQLWLNRDAGWNSSRVDACLIHLRDCPRQPINVRNRAKSEHDMALCRRRERDRRRRENNSLPTADFGTINIDISAALPAGSVPATSRRISEGISGSSIAPDIEFQREGISIENGCIADNPAPPCGITEPGAPLSVLPTETALQETSLKIFDIEEMLYSPHGTPAFADNLWADYWF